MLGKTIRYSGRATSAPDLHQTRENTGAWKQQRRAAVPAEFNHSFIIKVAAGRVPAKGEGEAATVVHNVDSAGFHSKP